MPAHEPDPGNPTRATAIAPFAPSPRAGWTTTTGHVNNVVVLHSWFDTAVNAHLIEQGVLDDRRRHHRLVVETQCHYFAPLSFPADHRGRHPRITWAAPACATRLACSPRARH